MICSCRLSNAEDAWSVCVIRACSAVRNLVIVDQTHGVIFKSGYWNHRIVNGSLFNAYSKCRCMGSARVLCGSMTEQDLVSCTALITALITGYSQEKDCSQEALELFCQLSPMGFRVDDVILCSMLNVCANTALLCMGRQIHAHTFKSQPGHDVVLGKCGDIQDTRHAFEDMRYKNVISWTSLITAYGKHGYGEDALTHFANMENDGMKPNDVTFLSLLSVCDHSGLTSKELDYFPSMTTKYGIQPRSEHYSGVVDLLACGDQLNEAYDIFCQMNISPSTSVWGALLGACNIYVNTSLGGVAAGRLCNLDPGRSVNYVVLRNIYAAAGFWEDAMKTRTLMIEKSFSKDAGCSVV